MSTYSTAILATTGLVSYWQLNETSGTTAADSKGTNTGTYLGGATLGTAGFTTGSGTSTLGTAVTASGTGYAVTVPNNSTLQITGNLSLECWFKIAATSSGSYSRLINKSYNAGGTNPFSDYDLHVNGNNSGLGFEINIGGTLKALNTNFVPSVNVWHHFVGSYDGSTMVAYLDSVQIGSLAQTGTITANTQPFTIGNFAGSIDEVAVYNVALSASQVLAHYNASGDGLQKARVSQFQALVIDVGTPTGRVSQLQTIVVGVGTPTARFSQTGVLFVGQGTPAARFSQAGVLFVGKGTPASRYSQVGMLAAYVGTPKVRTSQVGMLAVYRSIPTPVTQAAILTCM